MWMPREADYEDLVTARRENRVGDYEAALVHKTESGHELIVSTVDPRARWTLRVMGLGAVAGVVLTPAFAGVLLVGGLGAIAGDLVDRIDAFNHADMREVERLVDGSTANVIVVSDGADRGCDCRSCTVERPHRVVVLVCGYRFVETGSATRPAILRAVN